MTKFLVSALVVISASLVQAHNLDEGDIKTCGNKQFLVKLLQSKLSFDQQKALFVKSAKAVGFKDEDISFVGTGLTSGKEIIITLNKQRNVASVSPAAEAKRFAKFKNLVDEVNSQHEISYAECNVNFDPKQ